MAATSPERVAKDRLDVPADAPVEVLDVADLGPPDPLVDTLETLESIDDETVLVQRNDRDPQHLYPKLEDRGYTYETTSTDDAVITAIWRP